MSKKRGQLSLVEQKFIKDHFNKLSKEEIAEQLNRHLPPIERYINKIIY